MQALAITAQGSRVEHGLRRLISHQVRQQLQERRELRRTNANHQARVGAELAATLHHRRRQATGDGFRAHVQRLGQHDHRVDARHLGEHRYRLWTRRRHVAQRPAALERTGEAHRLNRRMLDQCLADATAIDHVEHTGRHRGLLRRADDCIGHLLGRGHVSTVGLEHHRTTGGQCRGGIATSRGKRQGKIAGTEHRHRPQADTVLAQIGARQRLAFRQRLVDARTVEVAAPQHLGEQSHLAAGAATLADNPCCWQRGFTANHRHELVTQGIELIGDGLEKLCATLGAQAAISRVCRCRRLGGSLDFRRCGLEEIVGQCLARFGIDTLQFDGAQRAALAADVVVAKNPGHG